MECAICLNHLRSMAPIFVVHDDMPVAHDNYQGYYVLTQKVYDFVLGFMSRNEELET